MSRSDVVTTTGRSTVRHAPRHAWDRHPPLHARERRPDQLSSRDLGQASLAVGVTVVGCVAAAHGNQGDIGPYGLASALPWLWYVAVVALCASSSWALFGRRRAHGVVLAVHVVGLVVLLHGAPGFLESEPRFATAWLHAGFTDQILTQGHTAPVDARFDWPGFFAAAAAVTGAAGLDSPLALLRWAPATFVLLYLPPLFVIARHLTRSTQAAWLALMLFVLVDWIGQDYFAPQSLTFLLYLHAVAVVVTHFRGPADPDRHPVPRSWLRKVDQGWDGWSDLPTSARSRVALLGLLVALSAALATSHQLSPIVLVLATTALVVVGRLRLTGFPVAAMVITVAWVSLGARDYWVGHLDDVIGSTGNLLAIFGTVSERVSGSQEHLVVVRVRLWVTAVVWVAGGLSAFAIWRRRRVPPLTLMALAVAPFPILAQGYGGEGMLRVFLFSSPFVCVLVSEWVTGALAQHRLGPVVAVMLVAVMLVALVPAFLVARYGNELFEQVRPGEIQALRVMYDAAPPGSNILSATSQVPWKFEHAADMHYARPADKEGFREGDPEAVRDPVRPDLTSAPATYFVMTRSQEEYGTQAYNLPEGWFDSTVEPLLTRANGYRLVFRNADAVVYRFVGAR